MSATTYVYPGRDDIAEALRELLREAKVSQAEAARRSGIPLTTLNRRLAGRGRPVLVSEMFALREVLGVSVTEMAARAESIAQCRVQAGR